MLVLDCDNILFGMVMILRTTPWFAGIAVVTRSKAALWTDGRYFLAAEEMLDCNWLFMKQGDMAK